MQFFCLFVSWKLNSLDLVSSAMKHSTNQTIQTLQVLLQVDK